MRLLIATALVFAAATSVYAGDWKDDALADIRSEKKVVEAMFTGTSSLWVSTRNDGSNRDGLASYFCTGLRMAGMPAGDFYVIHIWDAAKMAKGENVELGRAECAKN